jgi:molybdopterin synthase sulfur carrier subunit
MPVVWIPALLRDVTAGQEQVNVPGETVREVIEHLDERYPGIKERLCDEDDRLRPAIAVAVDGQISRLRLRQPLAGTSEVHFLPAISGG